MILKLGGFLTSGVSSPRNLPFFLAAHGGLHVLPHQGAGQLENLYKEKPGNERGGWLWTRPGLCSLCRLTLIPDPTR